MVSLSSRLTLVGAGILALLGTLAGGGCISSPNLGTVNDGVTRADGSDDLTATDDAAFNPEAAPPPDDASPDDPAHAACVAACPAGGTCDGATCVLACPGIVTCKLGVKCPPGIPCHIICSGARACGAVDCDTASTCRVDCNGDTACAKVTSASPSTVIVCVGKTACKDTRCDGDTCTVQCDGDACKPPEVKCCATTSCTVNGAPGMCK